MPPGYEEEDDNSLFIPFPGTTRQVNPPPYKGSDPEWQEFLKFSKDQGRQKRCKDDLAFFVCSALKQAPVLARYGNIDGVKCVQMWLTIDYPSRPPPEFMRSGLVLPDFLMYDQRLTKWRYRIEFTAEEIAWTSKHVDPDAVYRIKKALWPTAYGISLYAFFKTLIVQDVRNMLEALGIQTNKSATFDSLMAERMKNLGQLPAPKPGGPGKESLDKSLPATGDQKQNQTPAQTVPDGLNKRNALPSDDGSGRAEDPADGSAAGKARELVRGLEKNMIAPLVEAKKSLQKNWKHSTVSPTRGSVFVSGLIECELPKAIVTVDVGAWYDPKEGTYDTRTTVLNLRRLAAKRQGPARA